MGDAEPDPIVIDLWDAAGKPDSGHPDESVDTLVDSGAVDHGPADIGPDPAFADFSALVERRREVLGVPGLGVAVVIDGQLQFAEGFGERELRTTEPVTSETLFVVGSVTKPVVSAAILEMVGQGSLELDEPVGGVIDDFAAQPPEQAAALTPYHLLTHTSGYPNYPPTFWTTGIDLTGPDALDQYLTTHGSEHILQFPPGRLHLYSNFGYGLLGWILERVGQAPFDNVINQLVFEPYGMPNSTTRHVTDGELAVPHAVQGTALQPVSNYAFSPAQAPFAALRTSPRELGVFMERLLNAGSDEPLSRMFVAEVGASPRGSEQFTLGLYRVALEDGRAGFYHTGSAYGWTAKILLVPDSGFAVAVMANSDSSSVVFDVSREALLHFEATAEQADELPAGPMSQYVGRYETGDYGVVEVSEENGGLSILYVDSGERRRLSHFSDDQFVLPFPGGLDASVPTDIVVLATFWPTAEGTSTEFVTSPFGGWSVLP